MSINVRTAHTLKWGKAAYEIASCITAFPGLAPSRCIETSGSEANICRGLDWGKNVMAHLYFEPPDGLIVKNKMIFSPLEKLQNSKFVLDKLVFKI